MPTTCYVIAQMQVVEQLRKAATERAAARAAAKEAAAAAAKAAAAATAAANGEADVDVPAPAPVTQGGASDDGDDDEDAVPYPGSTFELIRGSKDSRFKRIVLQVRRGGDGASCGGAWCGGGSKASCCRWDSAGGGRGAGAWCVMGAVGHGLVEVG